MAALALAPAAAQSSNPPVPTSLPNKHEPVRVVVDPRIELMAALQIVNSYFLITRYDVSYRREMVKRFAPFVDEAAPRMFSTMGVKGFNYDAVPKAMLSFSPPPDLQPIAPVPADALQRAGGSENLSALMVAMREFAVRSQFMQFFAAHKDFYDELVRRTEPAVQEATAALENYSGMPLSNSTVVLGPALHEGGFGATIESSPSAIYAIIGPSSSDNGVPSFGSANRIENLIQHEFCHSFVNALTHRFEKDLRDSAVLYPPIASQMAQRAYGDWEITVNEMIVRALVSRLIARSRGETEADAYVASETSAGFQFVGPIAERLKEFERNRERYRNLEEFYPRIMNVLTSAADEERKQPPRHAHHNSMNPSAPSSRPQQGGSLGI